MQYQLLLESPEGEGFLRRLLLDDAMPLVELDALIQRLCALDPSIPATLYPFANGARCGFGYSTAITQDEPSLPDMLPMEGITLGQVLERPLIEGFHYLYDCLTDSYVQATVEHRYSEHQPIQTPHLLQAEGDLPGSLASGGGATLGISI